MINSEEFGMTFWLNDEHDLMYCPTFISGEPDYDQAAYVEDWDDWFGSKCSSTHPYHKTTEY